MTSKAAVFGCIEDRPVKHVNGRRTKLSFKQAPGADIFFAAATDIFGENAHAGSIQYSLADSVESATHLHELVHVHNDDSNGSDYSGCSFLARLQDIYLLADKNFNSHLHQLEKLVGKIDHDNRVLLRHNIDAAARLARSQQYFDYESDTLIERALISGAKLITYTGEHAADTLTITTPRKKPTSRKQAFHLDIDQSFKQRAIEYSLDPEQSALLAAFLSVVTVSLLTAS